MTKIDSLKLVKEVKERAIERKNYTFKLSPIIVDRFKKVCEANDVYQGEIIEGLIWSFLEGLKGK